MVFLDPLSLHLFVVICDEQSLTEAADRVSLTKSAVSKRLVALEQQIGAPLLERGRKGVKLTVAGEAMLPAARSLLQSMSLIQARISEYGHEVGGHVRVAASMSPISSFLPADIAEFGRRHGDIRVSLTEGLSVDVVRSVLQDRADLGVCWEGTGLRRLETVPYRADRLVVIAHKDHELARRKSVSFAETLNYDRVAIQGGSIVQLTQQSLAVAAGAALKDPIQVRNYHSACRAVASNLAVAIVPKASCQPLVKSLGLKSIALSDDWALRRFVVCVRNRAELTAPARMLLDMLASQWYGSGQAAG